MGLSALILLLMLVATIAGLLIVFINIIGGIIIGVVQHGLDFSEAFAPGSFTYSFTTRRQV